jgi:predicted nuclease of predicted toxin-antitoxin system
MTISLYMDHNVPRAVVEGCRSSGLNVLTAFEDGWHERSDDELLDRARSLARVVFTQDTDFIALATERLTHGISFSGVIFCRHGSAALRNVINDLVLICHSMEIDEVSDLLIWLPL